MIRTSNKKYGWDKPPSSSRQNVTAVIYDKRGRVLSIGKNSYAKTHRIQAEYAKSVGEDEKIFIHAEIDAIIRCKNIDKADKIIVSRIKKDGSYGLAKPCKICAEALKHTPINHIEWTC